MSKTGQFAGKIYIYIYIYPMLLAAPILLALTFSLPWQPSAALPSCRPLRQHIVAFRLKHTSLVFILLEY